MRFSSLTSFSWYAVPSLIAAILVCLLYAEEQKTFFSGGMALQAGYASLKNEAASYQGVITGMGGRIHFYTGAHVRVGSGGASVKMAYTHNGFNENYTRIGYAGVTLEATTRMRQWQLSAGILAGGAGYTNLHIIAETSDGARTVLLENRRSFLLSPLITIERALSKSLSLMGMMDYLWGPELGRNKHLKTPKLHVGVLFNK